MPAATLAKTPVLETDILGWPVRRGKVRDIYDLGERLLLVATDRISAFDWVMPNGIPDKGRVLTGLSHFWFRRLGVRNHLGSAAEWHDEFERLDLSDEERAALEGRCMVVRKFPVV